MGVLDFENYRLSEHAFGRLHDRFNVPRADAYKWMCRALENATYIRTDPDGRDVYEYNEIILIIEPLRHRLLTAYQKETARDVYYKKMFNMILEKSGMSVNEIREFKHITWKVFKQGVTE